MKYSFIPQPAISAQTPFARGLWCFGVNHTFPCSTQVTTPSFVSRRFLHKLPLPGCGIFAHAKVMLLLAREIEKLNKNRENRRFSTLIFSVFAYFAVGAQKFVLLPFFCSVAPECDIPFSTDLFVYSSSVQPQTTGQFEEFQ